MLISDDYTESALNKIHQNFGSQFVYEDSKGVHICIDSLVIVMEHMNQRIQELESKIDALEYVTDTSSYYE